MGKIQPKQSPDNIIDFASKVKEHLDAKGRNASWLAQRARVSKTTITRLLNNTDHRGNPYHPDRGTVIAICLALRITKEQRWELVSHNTVYELVRSGAIHSVRVGRNYRIPLEAVIDYLYKH